MSDNELEEATEEAITLLVDEAQHGLVRPSVVVTQLHDNNLRLYLYFYLAGLFRGAGLKEHGGENRDRLVEAGQHDAQARRIAEQVEEVGKFVDLLFDVG